MIRATCLIGIVSCLALSSTIAQAAPTVSKKDSKGAAQLSVKSTAFTEGSIIPNKFTGDGQDVSPPLTWSDPPASAKSIALTVEDPDAPAGTWFHWIIFNIPPSERQLSQGIEKAPKLKGGITQGSNDFRKLGYNGPAPPKGSTHHYQFKLVALDSPLTLQPGCTKTEFYGAIKGHVLARGTLTGLYSRK
ncbi:MAG: YbhB/YbcL family Raf kinase inhibitor-like protein [Cyanobacteria bacterium]|nr:YbhB/YbcL family Raf kinase inhibitor-like protein [Cyanobacteriota bacterium]